MKEKLATIAALALAAAMGVIGALSLGGPSIW